MHLKHLCIAAEKGNQCPLVRKEDLSMIIVKFLGTKLQGWKTSYGSKEFLLVLLEKKKKKRKKKI